MGSFKTVTTTAAKSSTASAVGPLVKLIVSSGGDEGGEGWEDKMGKLEAGGVLTKKDGMFLKWNFGEEEEEEEGGKEGGDKGYNWVDDPEGAFLYGVTKGRKDEEKVGDERRAT